MILIKERMSDEKFLPRWVRLSHQALYEFSAQYVKNKKVLDCACGEGFGSELFLKSDAALLIGVDISPEAIKIAKSKVTFPGASFIQGDATSLPFSDSEFDVYISIETIEHVKKDGLFLKEAFRVIKPGGIFICSSPNREVMNPGKTINDKPLNKFHIREYSRDEFCSILGATFDKVSVFGLNPNSNLKIKLLNKLGMILPNYGAARINQAIKLPKLLFDNPENYLVQKINPKYCYELLVAVCLKS